MKAVVRCSCGKRVRIDLGFLHCKPQCPLCKCPVKVGFWHRLFARITSPFGGTISNKHPSTPNKQPAQQQPAATIATDVEQLLHYLGERAWRKDPQYPTGDFLLSPTKLMHGSNAEAMEFNLKAMYEHARRWAPELTVPYKVPRVQISESILHPGQIQVDSDGWVSIDLSTDFASRIEALYVILAHEACHHILDLSGLNDNQDRARNERMTDLTIFIVGFGNIVKAGRITAMQTPTGYVNTHLGYLDACDYDFAYNWVLEARTLNGLPSHPSSGLPFKPQLYLPDPTERLIKELKGRIHNAETRQRLIKHYRAKYPQESEDEIIRRILDDQERDNR